MKNIFKKYLELRNCIDSECSKLWKIHFKNMSCKSGCSSCCQAFKVLPIEHEFIKAQLATTNFLINRDAKLKDCKFLVEDKCTIYEHRPIICRTHGYPLVRLNEEVQGYEVSYCNLNFKNISLSFFNTDNVFFEDTYNSKLYQINKTFLDSAQEENYEYGELVELNSLAEV